MYCTEVWLMYRVLLLVKTSREREDMQLAEFQELLQVDQGCVG